MKTPHQILGVKADASEEDIRKAYRKKAHKLHPDKGGDPKKFRELNEAYEALTGRQKKLGMDPQHEVMMVVYEVFAESIRELVDGRQNARTFDVVRYLIAKLQRKTDPITQERLRLEAMQAFLKESLTRFEDTKKDQCLLKIVAMDNLRMVDQKLPEVIHHETRHKEAMQLLKSVRYRMDVQKATPSTLMQFIQLNSSGG